MYEELIDIGSLHWFCEPCEDNVLKPEKDPESKLMPMLMKLTEQLTVLDKKVEEKADASIISRINTVEATLVGKLTAIEQNLDKKADLDEVTKLGRSLNKTEQIAAAEALHQDLLNRVDHIKSKLDKPISSAVQGCIEGALKSQLNEDKAEEQEIQRRRTSVIVHGIAESDADSADERIDNDILQIAAMLEELGVTGAKVEQAIRLGKKQTDSTGTQRPRPLKIVFDTEDNKIQVIRKAKNLRDKKDGGWEKVFVHQDLTPRQREERNKLVQELKGRLAQGEKDLVIYRGEIVRRRRY